ncbi:ThiS family protein [uncultured archaeon]|nr:ThiS family protein [uncultured archaeon]
MHVQVTYGKQKKKLALRYGAIVLDVIQIMKINPEMVLVKRGGEIIPDTEELGDNDKIEIIQVVSGG